MSHPLLRTLISEMVETYLEESYEDDLVESIFEEVSNETWEAIEEARILECAHDVYRVENVLRVAQKLSGAPQKIVEKVYEDLLTIA
jgi:hypothetical protein